MKLFENHNLKSYNTFGMEVLARRFVELETAEETLTAFLDRMLAAGVQTAICTDISRDGMLRGTNRELYASLAGRKGPRIVASGGVSSLEDIRALRDLGLYGAILGKAYYTGAVDLREALEAAQ